MTGERKSEQMILAISGQKNSGKTTLITGLLPKLNSRGMKVAVIKHDGHDFQTDIPGTDTWKMAKAGALGTLIFSEKKYMMIKYEEPPAAEELIAAFPEADLILLEGFKYSCFPKLEVVRSEISRSPVCDPDYLRGIVTDLSRQQLSAQTEGWSRFSGMPIFELEDTESIGNWIYTQWKGQ